MGKQVCVYINFTDKICKYSLKLYKQ